MVVPKFRAWDKVNRKMYGIDGFRMLEGKIYRCSLADNEFRDEVLETIHYVEDDLNNFALMQSTGLIDPQGVEVFEGDVLYYPENPEGEKYGIVVWQKESLAFVLETAFDYLPYNLWLVGAVVGNIYENPELRKVVE